MVHLYKQWTISLLPSICGGAWTFYLHSPEGDLLSNHHGYDSVRSALQAAQKYVDNHLLFNEVIEILDPLLASNAMNTDTYVRCIEIFRTLAIGSASDESVQEPDC